ncbi:MAG: DUF6057 family protein [Bacteroidota bacterium]|nr:DUF6057 family protein [Bacteroidota bacterium]
MVRRIWQLLFVAFSFLYLFFYCGATLSVMEQMQIFLYDKFFFYKHFAMPGGLLTYLSEFLIQFFYYSGAGAFIVTMLLLAIQELVSRMYRISDNFYFISFIPSFLLLLLQTSEEYAFSNTAGIFLVAGALFFNYQIQQTTLRYASTLASILLLYVIAGGYAFFFAIAAVTCELFKQKEYKRLGFILVLIVSSVFVWFIAYKFVFVSVNAVGVALEPFPKFLGMSGFSEWGPYLITWLFFILAPAMPCMVKRNGNKVFGLYFYVNVLSLALMAFFTVRFSATDRNLEKLFLMGDAAQKNDWDEVLQISGEVRQPGQLLSLYTNIALCKKGVLGDKMFFYEQPLHEKGMYAPFQKNPIVLLFGSDLYYQLGLVNYAYRWLMEGTVINGLSSRFLIKMAHIAIINKDYALAQKYLNTLKKTLFYKRWALNQERYINSSDLSNSDIKIKRALLPTNDYLIGEDFEFEAFLTYFLKDNPKNRFAFDYFMGYNLLSKNLAGFVRHLPLMPGFGQRQLPRHYQEALLIYAMQSGDKSLLSGISPEVQSKFDAFNQIFYGSPNPEQARKQLVGQFKNTYWYYFLYVNNPKAN